MFLRVLKNAQMQVELCEIPLCGGPSFDKLRINSPEE
jgi:hypothetical protein